VCLASFSGIEGFAALKEVVESVDTVVFRMEVVKGWTGQEVGYSAKGSVPCITHGGNEILLPYKRKWDVNGLNNNNNNNSIGFGKKQHKRERGQGRSHQVYDPSSSRITGMQRKKKRKTRRNGFARMHVPRTVPRAPYNDSSFLIKVRRAGGLAALVSPATFSTLKTTTSDEDARASCYREEEVLEPVTELGVGNGYGSMTGLIHLRATDDGSSCSTVDEIDIDSVQQQQQRQQQEEDSSFSQLDSVRRLEQRLDRDVSRFEMTLPSPSDVHSRRAPESLEERVARQDRDIALLEDENLTLKERLSLMQQAVYEYQERLARMSQGEVDQLPAECSNHGSSD
jgi:hypothetical protein